MLKYSVIFVALLVSTLAQGAETFALKDFAQFGIQAKAVKLVDPRFENLSEPEDKYYLEVKLGRLTQEQFDSMMALYGNRSKVAYDSKKEYDLVDFLHPAIQATVNQVFTQVSYDTSRLHEVGDEGMSEDDTVTLWGIRKNGVGSWANCWNTTMQILRLQHASTNPNDMRYQIYWPGRWTITEELQDTNLSSKVEESALKAGDALIVLNKNDSAADGMEMEGMVQHTAYVLSDSLIFEKTDSGDDDPYRISFRKDVVTKYKRVFEDGFLLAYRRFNQPGQTTFAAPTYSTLKQSLSEKTYKVLKKIVPEILDIPLAAGCETAFGGGCDVMNSEFHEVKVVTNPKTGRGIFYAPRKFLDRFQSLKGK